MRFWRVPGQMVPVQMADEVVGPGQIADEVLEQLMRFRRVPNSRQRSWRVRGRKLMRSRGFWCTSLMRFQKVSGQIKNLPRSSKLLGITHEFIFYRSLMQTEVRA